MNAKQLVEIRARAEAIAKLFPPAVNPDLDPDTYYSVIDKWGDEIFTVSPRFLGPSDTEAARDALFRAQMDIPALLEEIERLRAALREIVTTEAGENSGVGVYYDTGVQEGVEMCAQIARAALGDEVAG